MMSVEQGMYFGLDGVGPRIWSLLATPRTFGDLCRELQHEFDVEPDVCRDEVQGFLSELMESGLVHVHGGSPAPSGPSSGA
ncbi:MAG: PqqD family protein [Gemmatimonadetes bacterium]|nr:PqqD family protein [Gemmatimonadota bacterium]